MARLSADERRILTLFSYKRPSGSVTEAAFIDLFLAPLGFERDQHRNLRLTVGENPTILFSSHVDTVHSSEGVQKLDYRDGILQLTRREKRGRSNCLGADDTAGIWLMMEMVKAGVPGHYVIHHAEESGCIGSSDLAKSSPEFLRGFKAAIAFDRNYTSDIITHQMGRRCASDAFARSLANQLGGGYEPDPTGSYTDTNEYAHLIPECTNISVGYRRQHSANETQDVHFLIALRDRLLAVDWSALKIERDPESTWEDEEDFEGFYGCGRRTYDFASDDFANVEMVELVRENAELIADILESYGISRNDILDEMSRHNIDAPRRYSHYGTDDEDLRGAA